MDMLSFGLLECYESCPGEAAWMYRAVEQVYRPFIPCLSAEEADRLYLRYKALRKRDPGLSVQTEILKALKKQRT